MVNVAIYVRLSDEDRNKQFETDESESIQNQKSMLSDFCKERNWEIYDIYCDEDYSGTDSARPEFNRMLKDCERGRIDTVLCKSQSRFSRDMEVIEKYIHNKFIEWDVRFIGVVDHADTADVSNKKSRQINGLVNEWYLEDVSENIRKTLQHKREKGEFTGSFAPYGYSIDPENKNHLVIDKNVAPIVKDIFNWYVQGWGYRKIVMELNRRGIPSPALYKEQNCSNFVSLNEKNSSSRGLWTHPTIFTIIRNETYIGMLVQGKSHNVSYKNKKRKKAPKEDWIIVPNTHEAIIDKEIWDKAQERISSRVRSSKISNEVSVLSRKVKCAECGKPMKRGVYYNSNRTKQYYNLTCASYKIGASNCPNISCISGMELEKVIVNEINDLINQYCNIDDIQINNCFENEKERLVMNLNDIRSKIEAQEKKITSSYEDKLDGLITTEQYIIFSKRFEKEALLLKERAVAIQEQIDIVSSKGKNTLKRDDVLKKYTHIDKLTREIVLEFIDTIYIGEKRDGQAREINIKWNF